jgi:hypothetical protein
MQTPTTNGGLLEFQRVRPIKIVANYSKHPPGDEWFTTEDEITSSIPNTPEDGDQKHSRPNILAQMTLRADC